MLSSRLSFLPILARTVRNHPHAVWVSAIDLNQPVPSSVGQGHCTIRARQELVHDRLLLRRWTTKDRVKRADDQLVHQAEQILDCMRAVRTEDAELVLDPHNVELARCPRHGRGPDRTLHSCHKLDARGGHHDVLRSQQASDRKTLTPTAELGERLQESVREGCDPASRRWVGADE